LLDGSKGFGRREAGVGIDVDRDRVKRALGNVLDNAIRYSPDGAPVHASWGAVDGSAVQITVRDHGPGFDTDLLPHAFEAGVRGKAAHGASNGGRQWGACGVERRTVKTLQDRPRLLRPRTTTVHVLVDRAGSVLAKERRGRDLNPRSA
jgi:hypothetical protein